MKFRSELKFSTGSSPKLHQFGKKETLWVQFRGQFSTMVPTLLVAWLSWVSKEQILSSSCIFHGQRGDFFGIHSFFRELLTMFLKNFRTCFIFWSPQKKDIKMNEILGPFDSDVWKLMAVFSIVCMWIMTIFFKYENISCLLVEFSNSFILGSFCQQGNEIILNNQWKSLIVVTYPVFINRHWHENKQRINQDSFSVYPYI